MVLTAAVPQEHLRERALQAFESGALSSEDYLRFDWRIGWHQYNDCLILQMISNEDGVLSQSLGPPVYYPEDFNGFCRAFRALLEQELTTEELNSFRYTRYWHGHNAVTTLLLYGLDFGTVRIVLRAMAYLSLLVLALVALRGSPQLRAMGLTMAFFGAVFWGLPYFAQSPSHGTGDAVVVVGFIVLLAAAQRGLSLPAYEMLCAGFGATLVFMEFLTGLLPTAASLLLPFGYLAARPATAASDYQGARWRFALAGIVAFGVGVLITALLKQALAVAVFGPEVLDEFTNNLSYYAQNVDSGPSNRILAGLYAGMASIYRFGPILTYGSLTATAILFGTSLAAWIAALVLARRSSIRGTIHSWLACFAGASVILVWIIALPVHTFGHPYMVRMMIAPIALGWIALALQVQGLVQQPGTVRLTAQRGDFS